MLDSESSEDDEGEFFSNADILKNRAQDKLTKLGQNYVGKTGQMSEGRAYIEGGRQYQ